MIYISNKTTSIEVLCTSSSEWTVTVNNERKSFTDVKDMWCYIENFREKFDESEWEEFLDDIYLTHMRLKEE